MGLRILLATTVIWPSAARLAGAFASVGARVEALFPAGHMLGRSRYLAAGHAYAPLLALASCSAAIARAEPDLIVPCDDRAVTLLLETARRGKFTDLVVRSLGRLDAYPDLIGRSRFIQTVRGLGLVAPETAPVSGEEALETALARIGLPLVLKADGSYGGDGVVIARTEGQARAAFRKLSAVSRWRSLARAVVRKDAHFLRDAVQAPDVSLSAQRFVHGAPATTAFACWQGQVLATIHMDVLETLGSTGPASVMRRVDCRDMERAAHTVAAHFGLSGLHGLDFVRDAAGKAHLIEINPRATQASAMALGPGHDVVAALTSRLSPAAARPPLTGNCTIALFPQEWRRNRDSAWLKSAYLDVPWDDPEVLKACLEPEEASPQPPAALPLTVRQAVGR